MLGFCPIVVPMTTQERISRNVRLLMAAHGEQQQDLARRLGISAASVSDKLKGRRRWSVDDLDIIAAAYEIEVVMLLAQRWTPGSLQGDLNNVTFSPLSFRHPERVPGTARAAAA